MEEIKKINKIHAGRETTQWSESDFLRNRFSNFLGADMPQTIAAKELVDNATDQISDNKTSKTYLEIGKDLRSITVVDGGMGISTKKTLREDTQRESTYLYLAIAKLYNSTNYDPTEDDSKTVGFNGVGTKCNNFLSSIFTAGKIGDPNKFKGLTVVPKDKSIDGDRFKSSKYYNEDIFNQNYNEVDGVVYGYNFMQGEACIDGKEIQEESSPEWIKIRTPLLEGEVKPFGYLVHAQYDNSIEGFQDEIDPIWIKEYIRSRLESIDPKEDIYFTYKYPETDKEKEIIEMKEIVFIRTKDIETFKKKNVENIENGRYIILDSWDDQVKRISEDPKNEGIVFGPFKVGYFDMLFSKDADILKNIQNICQGSVVSNSKHIPVVFDVAGQNVRMNCPVVWRLSAKRSKGLLYTDQTKRRIQNNRSTPKLLQLKNIENQMRRIPELLSYWESEANSRFLKKGGKSIQSDFFFPASGGTTARQYFSYPFKCIDNAIDTLDRIKKDPIIIEFAKLKKYDITKISKVISSKKISSKDLKEAINTITEMQMIYHNVKEEDFDSEYKILLIVEGFSAASGVRTARDSSVIGVLALRGKILNVWNKTLANAMKSEIIKELLRVLQDDSYNLIVSCTDADADGSSITTLLLGCLARYRKDILREGRFCNNISPLYTFKDKKTKELIYWSNDKSDCPDGCKTHVNKGLGSYSPKEIKKLVLNPSEGAEWEEIVYDKNAVKSLTMALQSGGKELVYLDDKNNIPVPFIS